MTLLFRTFEPNKKQTKTLSEKLSTYGLTSSLFISLAAYLFEKITATKLPHFLFFLPFVSILGFLIHIVSLFVRLNEFENIDGTFNSSFKFGNDAIEFENKNYYYKDMSDFNIKIIDFYGAPTNNHRYGPAYKNGTSNYLSFITDGKEEQFYFEIKTEYFITAIYYHLIDIICNEKLPFQEKYLNLIPKKHKDFVVYRGFVSKLRAKNRIAN